MNGAEVVWAVMTKPVPMMIGLVIAASFVAGLVEWARIVWQEHQR